MQNRSIENTIKKISAVEKNMLINIIETGQEADKEILKMYLNSYREHINFAEVCNQLLNHTKLAVDFAEIIQNELESSKPKPTAPFASDELLGKLRLNHLSIEEANELVRKELNDKHATVFHYAVTRREIAYDVIEKYGRYTTYLNFIDEQGNTALHLACIKGEMIAINQLIRLGADVDIKNNQGETPGDMIKKAYEYGLLDTKEYQDKFLIASGKEAASTLFTILYHTQVDPTAKVNSNNQNSSYGFMFSQMHQNSHTKERSIEELSQAHALLGIPFSSKDDQVYKKLNIEFLILKNLKENHLSIKEADNWARVSLNTTVLHLAVKHYQHLDSGLVLQFSHHLNAMDTEGYTPLHQACMMGQTKSIKILTEHGLPRLNLNSKDRNSMTPLHHACMSPLICISDPESKKFSYLSDPKNAVLLINKGADINVADKDKMTPLHYACLNGHISLAFLLIEKGAKASAKAKNNKTPLDLLKQSTLAGQFTAEGSVSDLIDLLAAKESAESVDRKPTVAVSGQSLLSPPRININSAVSHQNNNAAPPSLHHP